MTRRELLVAVGASSVARAAAGAIDRRALVARRNPVIRTLDPFSPLSVGNGEFAFTADITGLQTFPAAYEKGIPLCTQSNWGWHSEGARPSGDFRYEPFEVANRTVPYAVNPRGQEALFNWLRENPHRFHLGRIGLHLDAQPGDLTGIHQTLNLWTGTIESRFQLHGESYRTQTACHPSSDTLAVRIEAKRATIVIEFPYPSSATNGADWRPDRPHRSELSGTRIHRTAGDTTYTVDILTNGAAIRQTGPHRFVIEAAGHLEASFTFRGPNVAAAEVFRASQQHWQRFWTTGGAIDFDGSTDQRAAELERRVVLSQYLTAIQCSGTLPPQETGLTCNSWFGKAHLEMHWWHAAHFPLWGRGPMLERSFAWYRKTLPVAIANAKRQGYAGARWSKMVGPDGEDSPSNIGPMLIWQQPHIIMLLHLTGASDRYRDLIVPTAEFMASYAEERDGRFHLGPPVIPAQENHPARETWDPTYELEYWRYALGLAMKYGTPAQRARWDRVRRNMAPLPANDGLYLAHANCPQTFEDRNRDHPSMLMACGFLPGDGVDRDIMRATLRKVMNVWKWPDTWGWDFPMIALTATRLGEPQIALDALLMEAPKNHYSAAGHNYQRPNLPLYLPGNGGLLTALATMANTPGDFPKGWTYRAESLHPLHN